MSTNSTDTERSSTDIICVVCNHPIDTRFRYKLVGNQASHMPSEICARNLTPEFPWYGTFQEQLDWADKYGEAKK